MLPRRERLSREEIAAVLRRGTRISHDVCGIRYLPAEHFKASVVISKKIAKTAVARHRMKRCIVGALQRIPKTPRHIVCFPTPQTHPTVDLFQCAFREIFSRMK